MLEVMVKVKCYSFHTPPLRQGLTPGLVSFWAVYY